MYHSWGSSGATDETDRSGLVRLSLRLVQVQLLLKSNPIGVTADAPRRNSSMPPQPYSDSLMTVGINKHSFDIIHLTTGDVSLILSIDEHADQKN